MRFISFTQKNPITMQYPTDDDISIKRGANGQETYVFDPYNEKNVEITPADVESILRAYGIDAPIHNFNLYKRAFVHQSYMKRPQSDNRAHNITIVDCPPGCLPLYSKSNERLEYIGDGVLENITKYYLYCRFPKEEPGFLTDKKIALVKNESIGKMALEMGLHRWLVISKHAESKQIRMNLKKLGCLFEAFVGAIFHDFNRVVVKDEAGWFDRFDTGPGFQMAQVFVRNVYEKHVDWVELVQNDDNFKNILQVRIQKEFKTTPHYMEIRGTSLGGTSFSGTSLGGTESMNEEESDEGSSQKYHMGVYLCLGRDPHLLKHAESVTLESQNIKHYSDVHAHVASHGSLFLFLGEGRHGIKKKAEQMASRMALERMAEF